MSASSLFSKLLGRLSALLLIMSTTLALLLRRRTIELRALRGQALHDRAACQRLAEQQAARHAAHLASLRQVAAALGAATEPQQQLDAVVNAARAALGVAHASIGQLDAAHGHLTIVAGSAASHDGALIGLELP